jgi:mRNA interferase RelE/StbE
MYVIRFEGRTKKDLSRVTPEMQRRVLQKLRQLQGNPRPPGALKLTNRQAWRVKIGGFRVIYEINDEEKSLTIVVLDYRGDVY